MSRRTEHNALVGTVESVVRAAVTCAARNPITADLLWSQHLRLRSIKRLYRVATSGLRRQKAYTPDKTLFLGLSSVCNARCCFCPYRKVNGERGHMVTDLAFEALSAWRKRGGCSVAFPVGLGEPTLHPRFFDICERARSLGYTSIMASTNGIKFAGRAQSFVDCGLTQLDISLGDVEREPYRASYGVDRCDEVMTGLDELLTTDAAAGYPVFCNIQFRSPRKPSEVLRSRRFKSIIAPHVGGRVWVWFARYYRNWGGLISESDLVGDMRMKRTTRDWRAPCLLLYQPVVTWDGNLKICPCINVGSGDDMLGLFSGSFDPPARLNDVLEGWRNGRWLEMCKGCEQYWV